MSKPFTSLAAIVLLTAVTFAQQAPAPAPGGVRLGRLPPLAAPAAPQEFRTLEGNIRAVTVVGGLASPWGLAFLPNGDMLVTEKAGRLRIVRNGTLDPTPIAGTPQVFSESQGALMEIALHPRFAENRMVYLTYSKKGEGTLNTTALARARFDGTALLDLTDIFVADAWRDTGMHYGSKLAFAPDGTLFMTVGERNDRRRAQDTTNHAGKVLRLKDDGTVPPDNPFVGKAGFRAEIYSYGHRNPQGLAIDQATGQVWETEHGPQGGDELNLILPGRNYGWPVVTYGREYTGEVIASQPWREGIEQPQVFWVPSIAASGLALYTGNRFPTWKGHLFAGGLAGQQLHRVVFTERGPIGREVLLAELKLRIRDVRQGTDGYLYVLTDGAGGAILRIEPGTAPAQTATAR